MKITHTLSHTKKYTLLDGLNGCVCVHKQKTRLARIHAVKSGGASAYLQYKHSQLLIDLDEEVTTEMQPSSGGAGVFWFLLSLLLFFVFAELWQNLLQAAACWMLHVNRRGLASLPSCCFYSVLISLVFSTTFSFVLLSCSAVILPSLPNILKKKLDIIWL